MKEKGSGHGKLLELLRAVEKELSAVAKLGWRLGEGYSAGGWLQKGCADEETP